MNETSRVAAPNAQLQLALDAIERNTSFGPATRSQYTRAVTNAVAAGVDLLDPDSLWAYGNAVGSSTRAFLSAVIASMTTRIENLAMSQATPENVAAVTATIYRARRCGRPSPSRRQRGSHRPWPERADRHAVARQPPEAVVTARGMTGRVQR